MTKSTITREQLEEWVAQLDEDGGCDATDRQLEALIRQSLAAMDSSESVELPLDYLQGHKDGLEWAAQLAEANHPETGYWLYDDPIALAAAIRKGPDMPPVQPVADSEPVVWRVRFKLEGQPGSNFNKFFENRKAMDDVVSLHELGGFNIDVTPLYRHAQPALVVPDDAKLRELFDSWFASDCSFDLSPEASEADNIAWRESYWYVWQRCRAAMFAAAPQEVKS